MRSSWRGTLLVVCVVALLVSPAAARPIAAVEPDAPSGPSALPHRVFLPTRSEAGTSSAALDLIDQALANGSIDSETALVYKIYAVFGDPRLPPQYRGQDRRVLGGTEAIADAVTRYPTLSAATQSILVPFLLPPSTRGAGKTS